MDNFTAYLMGRLYAYEHPDALPPCSAWLEEAYRLDPCARSWFLFGLAFTMTVQPFSGPIDTRLRECRCGNSCNVDSAYKEISSTRLR